jgi:hypothetical protein
LTPSGCLDSQLTSLWGNHQLTVIGKGSTVFQLLSGENESLLIRGNTLLVLDLALDIVDRVGRLDFEGDGLSSQGLDEDLHTSSQSEDEVESGLLLDVWTSAECLRIHELNLL